MSTACRTYNPDTNCLNPGQCLFFVQHKEKIRVEEGCVDLDPLSWPQAAESDGTGKPETTGTTCSCSVDSFVTRLNQTS